MILKLFLKYLLRHLKTFSLILQCVKTMLSLGKSSFGAPLLIFYLRFYFNKVLILASPQKLILSRL